MDRSAGSADDRDLRSVMDPFDEKSWMLGNLDGEMVGGPLSLNQVRNGLKDRSIQGTELLARAGSSAWRPIHEVLADPRSKMPSSMPPPRPDRSKKAAEWYVQVPGGAPEGPLATELVVLGVIERRIPTNARVCLVGATAWSDIAQVKEFANALRPLMPAPTEPATTTPIVTAGRDKLTLIVVIAVGALVVFGIVLVLALA